MGQPASILERQLLTPAALMVLQRLSQLPNGRVYNFRLLKMGDKWVLWMEDAKGKKVEVCK